MLFFFFFRSAPSSVKSSRSHPACVCREPVVPPGPGPQLPPGFLLGAHLQQCDQGVCGTAGPGQSRRPFAFWGRRDAVLRAGGAGLGMTCLSSAGVGRSREHRGLPLRDARGRLPQTRGGTHAAQGPVLGLRHRGAGDTHLICSLFLCQPELNAAFPSPPQGGWEHISVRGNSVEAPRARPPPPVASSRSPLPPQRQTQVNGNAGGV